ncbi:MAG: glycosyltransferase family 39 protein [Candidatus Rokubacteria bacterium]|nr:glycosyltransferase family 39 protein [Candidatus Rokubacteria bacterium]
MITRHDPGNVATLAALPQSSKAEVEACERAPRWAVGLVLVVAALVRVIGLSVGLSGAAVGDEPSVVQHALAFGSGDLNPHYYVYPAFHMYVLFALFAGYYAVGRLAGLFDSAAAFARAFLVDAAPFYLLARVASVAAGVAAVWVLYRFARQLLGERGALLAAALLAVNPFLVWDSHFAIADAPMVLFLSLGAWAIDRVYRWGRSRDYFWAGVVIGLGAATKYLPILMVVPLVAAHLWRGARGGRWWEALGDRRLWLAGGMVAVAFFVGSPFTVLDAGKAIAQIQTNVLKSVSGPSQNRIILLKLLTDYGVPFLVLVGAGTWLAARRGGARERLLLLFPAVYLTLALVRGYWATRYFSPFMPFACLLAALALVEAGRRWPRLAGGRFLALATAAVLAVPTWAVARDVRLLTRGTTREQATAWVEANVTAGSALATDPFFRFAPTPETLQAKLDLLEHRPGPKARLVAQALRLQQGARFTRPRYRLIFSRNYPDSSAFGIAGRQDYYSVPDYLERGAEYFVIGLPRYGEFEADTYRAFYGDLGRCCDVVHEIPPTGDPRLGTAVRIYRVRRQGG